MGLKAGWQNHFCAVQFGGFPEPFLKANDRFHRRWLREHSNRIVHEGLGDLENVREISNLDLLLHHLSACVGSPLSVNRFCLHGPVAPWMPASILQTVKTCYGNIDD